MGSSRPEKVQEALRQELSKIVQHDLKDPRIGFVTITRVELTKDLRFARVFFSVLGKERDKKSALYGLKSAIGFIKSQIAERVNLKFVPDFVFKFDETLEHAHHIQEILANISKKKKEKHDAKCDSGA